MSRVAWRPRVLEPTLKRFQLPVGCGGTGKDWDLHVSFDNRAGTRSEAGAVLARVVPAVRLDPPESLHDRAAPLRDQHAEHRHMRFLRSAPHLAVEVDLRARAGGVVVVASTHRVRSPGPPEIDSKQDGEGVGDPAFTVDDYRCAKNPLP